MNFFDYTHYHLVGIKGVAMTSLAQLLLDAGKSVTGSDVSEEFVTQPILDKLGISISALSDAIPETDCLIYTAAHQGKLNPQVQSAQAKNIPIFSHAEALSFFFNQKKGIAVCGVGGKSTVSAMISWILSQSGRNPSYSVGVGRIVGLESTGVWNESSDYFVAEADEYVTNPSEVQQGEKPIPRFSYLHPHLTVCTHLKYDHPDVYPSEEATTQTYQTFFNQITDDGILILNESDLHKTTNSAQKVVSFGHGEQADLRYSYDLKRSTVGKTSGTFTYQGETYDVTLQVPGAYNVENAAIATLACLLIGVPISDSLSALSTFKSTARRFEKVGEFHSVPLYDDYAHHPTEIAAVLEAVNSWYKGKQILVAFQPHTYSRTKQLFSQFIESLKGAENLVLLDIFASARESLDSSVSSQQLAAEISAKNGKTIPVLTNYQELATYFNENIHNYDAILTLGAGDIYKAYQDLLRLDSKKSV